MKDNSWRLVITNDLEKEDTDSNDDEDESPPASRAELNSGQPGFSGNHENHIVTTTDINVQQSEVSEDSSDDESEQEQTSTIIVTSRSPSNTQHSKFLQDFLTTSLFLGHILNHFDFMITKRRKLAQ